MEHESLIREASVDSKTAEEALALALRLQQERGERTSVAELHRVADEAGIDAECLSEALRQVEAKKKADALAQEQAALQSRERKVGLVMIAVAAVIAVVIVALARSGSFHSAQPLLAAMVFAAFVAKARRLRRCGKVSPLRSYRDRWM